MAGIGFELRKTIGKGNLGSFIKAAFSGILIVAGPWLLSILSISLLYQYMGFAIVEAPDLFMAIVVFCFAFSLIIFGGFHYIFTRIIADKIYFYKYDEASAALIVFIIPVFIIAVLIASAIMPFLDIKIAHPLMFKISAVLLFAAVNLTWVIMIFISLLKWYLRIAAVYLTGMAIALFGVYFLGSRFAVGGAMLGFALGHLSIAAMLLFLGIKSYKPGKLSVLKGIFPAYLKKYRLLFLTGLFYYWGTWVDKIVYWIVKGTPIAGTFFKLNEAYDIAVYFSTLSMIPGLVYFVIISEIDYYVYLRKFLGSLGKNIFVEIQKRKYLLLKETVNSLREQAVFQGVFTVILILLAPRIAAALFGNTITSTVLTTTLAAVYFHLMFLTISNYLFYIELYKYSLLISILFFTVNLVTSIMTALFGSPNLAGISYLAAGIAATILGGILLYSSIKILDRRILSGANTR